MLNNEMYESMQNMKTLDILISCMKTFNNPEHDVIVLTWRKGRGGSLACAHSYRRVISALHLDLSFIQNISISNNILGQTIFTQMGLWDKFHSFTV